MSAHDHAPESDETDVHVLDHHLGDYKKIITVLTVMTAIEFAISYLMAEHHIGLAPGIVVLVALAFVKAALVAKFFMHLRYDPKPLTIFIVIPLVLASPILMICCFDAIKGPSI
jgi:caa(3)-type oxidase subunit IV